MASTTLEEVELRFSEEVQTEEDTSVVLLGKTGGGKSSVGNLLLGRQVFEVKLQMDSSTKKCHARTVRRESRPPLRVVDTPGTMDTEDRSQPLRELTETITLCPRGIHAFLLVVRTDVRLTPEEKAALADLESVFSARLYEFSILVFTHADNLRKSETPDQFIEHQRQDNKFIHQLLDKCGNRWVMLDARKTHDLQERQQEEVGQLLQIIENLRCANGDRTFTNEFFPDACIQMAQKMWQAEEEMEEMKQRMKQYEEETEEMKRYMDETRKKLEEKTEELRRERENVGKYIYRDLRDWCMNKKKKQETNPKAS